MEHLRRRTVAPHHHRSRPDPGPVARDHGHVERPVNPATGRRRWADTRPDLLRQVRGVPTPRPGPLPHPGPLRRHQPRRPRHRGPAAGVGEPVPADVDPAGSCPTHPVRHRPPPRRRRPRPPPRRPPRRLAHRLGKRRGHRRPPRPRPRRRRAVRRTCRRRTRPHRPACGSCPKTRSPATSPSTPPKPPRPPGTSSRRLTDDTIDLYADPDGTHPERLDRRLLAPRPPRLQPRPRPSHQNAAGSPTPGSAAGRTCSASAATSSPKPAATPPPSARCARPAQTTGAATSTAPPTHSTTTDDLDRRHLTYAGTGWHTTGDAMLANTAAAQARERRHTARLEIATTG